MLAFIIYSIKNITERPRISSLKTMPKPEIIKKEGPKPKDLRLIYEENDLFGTYRPAFIPEKIVEAIPSLPQPPAPKPVIRQQPPPIQFLEPLPIKITGIIASSNEAKSQVSIMNNNTKKTDSYRVGDKLFDAYIIRIFPKKIIIIRSNGQQETLFLFTADAQAEITTIQDPAWGEAIQRLSEFAYLINPSIFVTKMTSLAQFIESVDITTAFKNEQSIGLRVGKMDSKSVGYALGFMPGDTVTMIQSIPPTTTKNRMKIYNALSQLAIGSSIKVQFTRRGQSHTNEYTLSGFSESSGNNEETVPALPVTPFTENEQLKKEVLQTGPEKHIDKSNSRTIHELKNEIDRQCNIMEVRQHS